MARVTVVNDNEDFLDLIREILEDDRYEVTTIDGDRPDAIDLIRQSRPDLLMLDLRVGTDGMHGWHVAQEVRKDPTLAGMPILICSADPIAMQDVEEELDAAHRTATIMKPFGIDDLTARIDQLLAEAAVQ
jgi:CheY-like chemotaxis protein